MDLGERPVRKTDAISAVVTHLCSTPILFSGLPCKFQKTNPEPIGARRSSCLCVMGSKAKEICTNLVHSCLSGSGCMAAIEKLPFLLDDAVECPE